MNIFFIIIIIHIYAYTFHPYYRQSIADCTAVSGRSRECPARLARAAGVANSRARTLQNIWCILNSHPSVIHPIPPPATTARAYNRVRRRRLRCCTIICPAPCNCRRCSRRRSALHRFPPTRASCRTARRLPTSPLHTGVAVQRAMQYSIWYILYTNTCTHIHPASGARI